MIANWFAGRRGRIRYRRWTPNGRPTALLLVLHGLGEHGGQYAPLAEAAAAAGVETWAIDHAGHGDSDGERVLVERIDDLVADAETLLAKACNTWPRVPVVIAGHSLGATVAALLVGEIRVASGADPAADVAGLVLAGSSLLSKGEGLSALLASGLDPMDLRKDPAELVRDPVQAQRVRDDPKVWDGGLRPQTLAALTTAGARTRALVLEGALDHLPVLVLHGGEDDIAPIAGAKEVADLLPRAKIVVYPQDRHNVLHDLDHEDVHAELLRFVVQVATA